MIGHAHSAKCGRDDAACPCRRWRLGPRDRRRPACLDPRRTPIALHAPPSRYSSLRGAGPWRTPARPRS